MPIDVNNCITRDGKMICWEFVGENRKLVSLTKNDISPESLSPEDLLEMVKKLNHADRNANRIN